MDGAHQPGPAQCGIPGGDMGVPAGWGLRASRVDRVWKGALGGKTGSLCQVMDGGEAGLGPGPGEGPFIDGGM